MIEQSSQWAALDITGDSVWPTTEGGSLQHLFDSAVRTHGNQTITGNVTIQVLSVPNLRIQMLNDKNISFIFHDTLSRQKENQVTDVMLLVDFKSVSLVKTMPSGVVLKLAVPEWHS